LGDNLGIEAVIRIAMFDPLVTESVGAILGSTMQLIFI
jgi:hypothetical protein